MPMRPAVELSSSHAGIVVCTGVVQKPTKRQTGNDEERTGFHSTDVVDLAHIDILRACVRELTQALMGYE